MISFGWLLHIALECAFEKIDIEPIQLTECQKKKYKRLTVHDIGVQRYLTQIEVRVKSIKSNILLVHCCCSCSSYIGVQSHSIPIQVKRRRRRCIMQSQRIFDLVSLRVVLTILCTKFQFDQYQWHFAYFITKWLRVNYILTTTGSHKTNNNTKHTYTPNMVDPMESTKEKNGHRVYCTE